MKKVRGSSPDPFSSGERQKEAKVGKHGLPIPRRTSRARSLRKDQTLPEGIMWGRLRARRFHGLKFKRQEPVGPYFADFICHEKRIILEVDGGHHDEDEYRKYDLTRTEYLENMGFRVIRYWNTDVKHDLDGVLDDLFEEIFGHESELC